MWNGTKSGMCGCPPCRCHPWIKTPPIPAFPGIPSLETPSAQVAPPQISTSWVKAGNLSLDKAPDPEKQNRPLTTHLSLFDLQISGIFHPNQLSSHLPLREKSSSCSIFCSRFLVSLEAPFGVFFTPGAAGTFPDTGDGAGLPQGL